MLPVLGGARDCELELEAQADLGRASHHLCCPGGQQAACEVVSSLSLELYKQRLGNPVTMVVVVRARACV